MKYCRLSPRNYQLFKTVDIEEIYIDVGIHPILLRHGKLDFQFMVIDDVYSVRLYNGNNKYGTIMPRKEIIHQ